MPTPHVIITGPSGYLGRNLAACFRQAQWRVSGAGRHPQADLEWFGQLDLGSGVIPDWPKTDLFIHAAYDFSASTSDEVEQRNVQASIRLLQAAQKSGAERLIFISSMSAHAGARSWYGKGKWRVEQFCHENGIIVIRPGLLYGAPQGGLAGSLARVAGLSPLLPYPYYADACLHACHVADTCLACLALARLPFSAVSGRPLMAAHDRLWRFKELLTVIATAQGRSPRLIPIPWRLPWGLLRLAERVGLKPSFRSDSLVSLASTAPDFDPTALDLGLSFRPLTPGTFSDPTPIDPTWSLPQATS